MQKRPVYFLALLLFTFPAHAEIILTLNTTGVPPLNTLDKKGFMDRVSFAAFKRIGIRLETVKLPAERGLKNVNAGREDGEMSRIAGLEKKYPNMIRVPETIMDWEFHAFSNREIKLADWTSLKPYEVAFINGWKILEANIPEETHITKVKNSEQLFNLLMNKRTDLIIYERWGGLLIIKDRKLSDTKIVQPPLAVRKMYIYLHKKHKELVPKLAQALKQLKTDGTYQKIYNETLAPLK